MIKLTRSGILLLLVCFFMFVASLQSDTRLLMMILGLVFSLFIVNLFSALRSCFSLKLTAPPIIFARENEHIRSTWDLSNSSKFRIGHITIKNKIGDFFKIALIDGKSLVHLSPDCRLDKRGHYPYDELIIESSFPFGLISASCHIKAQGEIIVFPAVYPCSSPPAAGFEPVVGGKYAGQNKSSAGDSFHGIRPLQSGDPVKLIHWKSSSRGLGLMVKEFEEELAGRISIIVDPSNCRSPENDLYLDWSARACSSVIMAAQDMGHQLEFTIATQDIRLSLPPFADGENIFEQLARLDADTATLSVKDLEAAVDKLPTKSALSFFLTSLNKATGDFINELSIKRKVIVYLPEPLREDAQQISAITHFYQKDQIHENA